MYFWLQMKCLTVRLAIVSTKLSIRRALLIRKARWRVKLVRAQIKARLTKRKAVKAAKDLIIPSLPGVSKLKLPEPPAPHLLSSNLPPSDSEIILVQKAIREAEATESQLKQKLVERIAAGQSSRGWETVTRHKIGQAARFIHQHKGILSPIRRIPLEILQEIFIWATPTVRVHTRWRPISELPWEFAQVSQPWRASALSISMLWNHLPAIQLKRSRAKTRRQVECLNELLRRSGEAPLDIYIHSSSFEGDTHPVIDTLVRHSERWQILSIDSTSFAIAAFRPAKGRLSSLKILTLQTHSRSTDAMPPTLDMFEVAPQLRAVYMSGHLPDLKLPFSQLVHYKERMVTTNRINQVAASSLLESLTILELSDDTIFPDVTIPHLVKLQVKFHYRSRTDCFDHLTLPAIEEIKIVSWGGNLIASLISMLSRSDTPCPLKTLSVRTESIEPDNLTTLLKLTPALVSLDTTIPFFHADIANLATREGHQPLVPMLETCKFYLEDVATRQTTQALNDLAASRCELANDSAATEMLLPGELRPLKSLSVYFDGSPWSHLQQAEFENWNATTTIMEIPEIVTARPARTKAFNRKWMERVGAILDSIEDFPLEDPNDVYVAGIHFSLKHLSEMKYPTVGRKCFCRRAKDILEKWHPLFLENLPRRHWTFQGPYSMVYVSGSDPIRTSPDALDIVYGLKDETTFPSVFWPMFMSHP
ncbi:hypothetical protein BDZ97DRAFT_1811241 [Flammula alnicola]|nr:hypothetical protein BDZ97DRAFT_1811241 [Flammula alnicola]